eukprot:TRINITY_DN2665_c0_g1_i1.p1 TRINITY_DN2665_c0_g1~~TRINITY_DN2665_c0_g1_i1.p1  ORF type:complete len:304 (+),score=24.21 TRINITY_DN2665_c0_g1_i1:139-1050(+)
MSPPEVIKCESTGLEKVLLKEPSGSSAEVYLHGGHVTSWRNDKGEEQLFLSSKAVFKPPKAIRGGIPICFPQFGKFGSLDQHGFARNRKWSLDPLSTLEDPASVDILLASSNEDLKLWPHSFELRMRVSLDKSGHLSSVLRVSNTDTKSFSFTFALHTYLSVSDISEVRIEGLETMDYLDNLEQGKRVTDQGDSLTFDSEVDRIYLSTPSRIAIVDHSKKKTFLVSKDGLPDAVVWNPWDRKAKAMSDFGDEDYKRMVCVEAAAVEKPIVLKPGEEWIAKQELSTVSSSFYSGQLDPHKVLHG